VWLDFYFFLLTVEGVGRGARRLIFFSFSFDLWKGEGRGVNFFLKIVFSLLSG
jgi:hypothetical protein